MNRLIGTACPACKQLISAEGDLQDDAAMCVQCGAVIWTDDVGTVRVIDDQELARFDSEIKRTIARALDELDDSGRTESVTEIKEEWLVKMQRYYAANPKFALNRARRVIEGNPTDWDENTPVEWAREFLIDKPRDETLQ